MKKGHCEACDVDVEVNREHTLHRARWRLVLWASWVGLLFVGPFIVTMPPLSLATVPLFAFGAMALIGRASDEANRKAACPTCGRHLTPSRPATQLAGRAAGPAHERFVESALVGKA